MRRGGETRRRRYWLVCHRRATKPAGTQGSSQLEPGGSARCSESRVQRGSRRRNSVTILDTRGRCLRQRERRADSGVTQINLSRLAWGLGTFSPWTESSSALCSPLASLRARRATPVLQMAAGVARKRHREPARAPPLEATRSGEPIMPLAACLRRARAPQAQARLAAMESEVMALAVVWPAAQEVQRPSRVPPGASAAQARAPAPVAPQRSAQESYPAALAHASLRRPHFRP